MVRTPAGNREGCPYTGIYVGATLAVALPGTQYHSTNIRGILPPIRSNLRPG